MPATELVIELHLRRDDRVHLTREDHDGTRARGLVVKVIEPGLGKSGELLLRIEAKLLAFLVRLGELGLELGNLRGVRGFHVLAALILTQRLLDVVLQLLLQDQGLQVGLLASLPRVRALVELSRIPREQHGNDAPLTHDPLHLCLDHSENLGFGARAELIDVIRSRLVHERANLGVILLQPRLCHLLFLRLRLFGLGELHLDALQIAGGRSRRPRRRRVGHRTGPGHRARPGHGARSLDLLLLLISQRGRERLHDPAALRPRALLSSRHVRREHRDVAHEHGVRLDADPGHRQPPDQARVRGCLSTEQIHQPRGYDPHLQHHDPEHALAVRSRDGDPLHPERVLRVLVLAVEVIQRGAHGKDEDCRPEEPVVDHPVPSEQHELVRGGVGDELGVGDVPRSDEPREVSLGQLRRPLVRRVVVVLVLHEVARIARVHHVLEAPYEDEHGHQDDPEHGEPSAGDEELRRGEVGAARGGERVALVVVEAGQTGALHRGHVVGGEERARVGGGVVVRRAREALHVRKRWARRQVGAAVDHVAVQVQARDGGGGVELEVIGSGRLVRRRGAVDAVRASRGTGARAG